MKKLLYITVLIAALGCETEINPTLNNAAEIMVVDAWITQKMERQVIRVTSSQTYFDNSVPAKVDGAIVRIEDLESGADYVFEEGADGYFWEPTGLPFGEVGHTYRLTVTTGEETFEAFSRLGRVPPVDTITFKYNPKDFLLAEPYFTSEFMATDPVGEGDAYWVKAWKNDVFLGKPAELNMVYDGGFSASNSVDGEVFILPVRRDFINPMDNANDKDTQFIPPYQVGDSITVEIHSVDHAAFEFLFGVYFNINRPGGFAELFAFPLANSTTNLKSTDSHSVTNVAGFFNVSAVSTRGQKLSQPMADEIEHDARDTRRDDY